MNKDAIEKSANFYHKGTMAILEKLIGTKASAIVASPIIFKKGTEIFSIVPGKKDITNNMDYMLSYIMNGSFSLEIKIKLLLLLESNKWENGHRLLMLYDKLSEPTTKFIEEALKEITSKTPIYKGINRKLNEEFKINFSWNAQKLISNSSQAFESWRYSFEKEKELTWFAGYLELQDALNSRIEMIRE